MAIIVVHVRLQPQQAELQVQLGELCLSWTVPADRREGGHRRISIWSFPP